jgi:hypothetical protein
VGFEAGITHPLSIVSTETREICRPYSDICELLFAQGVFDGAKRVLVSGCGAWAELGSLLLLSKDKGLSLTVDGVDYERSSVDKCKEAIDGRFGSNRGRIIEGDVRELRQLAITHDLRPWDLFLDQESGPLAMTLGNGSRDSSVARATSLLKTYSESQNPGGRLVITRNFNLTGLLETLGDRVNAVNVFLASGESPYYVEKELSPLVVLRKKK